MAPHLVITIDAGTGSNRVCVYDLTSHRSLAVAARDCPIDHPAPDRAEWQPDRWWQAIIETLTEAVGQAGRPPGDYLGLTVTSLRQGFVLLDELGEPLAPGVLNYDRRGADWTDTIEQRLPIEQLYTLTGHWHAPELTLPKLLWFQKECPDLWQRVRHMLFVHDWALFKLTGRLATSASMVAAGQMADCTQRTWALDLLESLGIPEGILPPVFEGGRFLGGLQGHVAELVGLNPGLPVHVGCGDTQFGCLGTGGMGPDRAVIVGGSTTPLMMTTGRPVFDPLRYPWVSPHLIPGLWAVETNAGHTGMLYKWFRDTFGQAQVATARAQGRSDYGILNDLAADAPLGAGGLLVVATSPRWAQDTWRNKAPYIFYNFQVSHSIGHVARAIMEAVCFGVRGNLDQLERVAGKPLETIIYTGGSAGVRFWAQMMANVLGRPLVVPKVREPSAVAGAQLVLWGQGRQQTLPPPPFRRYEPETEQVTAYESIYQSYLDVFEKMQRDFGT